MPEINLTADLECDFCGDYLDLSDVKCMICGGSFCSTECEQDHRKPGVVPHCGVSMQPNNPINLAALRKLWAESTPPKLFAQRPRTDMFPEGFATHEVDTGGREALVGYMPDERAGDFYC